MSQARFLWVGYIGMGVLMTGLILLNPNRFTSVDSTYYLQSATNLLAGRGYVVSENGQLVWNGTFPIGYSALIAALSGLTGLPVLAASKLVNYVAIGISFYCWIRRLGVSQAAWILSIWMAGGFLKIAIYTWSETLFLVLLADWVWNLQQFLLKPGATQTRSLLLIGLCLWLTRYIGGFVFGLSGSLAIAVWLFPNWFQAQPGSIVLESITQNLLIILASGFMFVSAYFWINQQLSGSLFGGERFMPTGSPRELSRIFGWAILNEFLLIRDFATVGLNKLAFMGLGIQGLLVGRIYWQLRRDRLPNETIPSLSSLSRLFLITACTYLVTLFTLRIMSPFSDPSLRLMAPFTFCFLTAGFLWIGNWPTRWQRILVPYWLVLVLCSWLQLLPQADLAHKISLLWRW